MQVLGIQTDDFAAYHDMVQLLRERGIDFISLAPGEPVPSRVGVLLTSAENAAEATFPHIVVITHPEETLEAAQRTLAGYEHFRRCVIGIDPGERPGLAVLADGRVIRLIHASTPEAVRDNILHALDTVPADAFLVRIGDGAPTFRDRTLRALEELDLDIELVDETNTTPVRPRGLGRRDTAAATHIALSRGAPLVGRMPRAVRPTEGELRDIQRKSRLVSDGRVTISRALARHVALGTLTLDEAVLQQQAKAPA